MPFAVQLREQQRLVARHLRRQAALDVRAADAHRQARRRACRRARRRRRRRGCAPATSSPAARRARRAPAGTARRPAPTTLRPRDARLEDVQARLAARRGEVHDPRARAAAAVARAALGDAPHAPAEVLVDGLDGDGGLLAAGDRLGRRLRGEVAHGDAAAAGERLAKAGAQRQRRGAADVARLVARADDDEVGPGGDAPPVDAAVPLPAVGVPSASASGLSKTIRAGLTSVRRTTISLAAVGRLEERRARACRRAAAAARGAAPCLSAARSTSRARRAARCP